MTLFSIFLKTLSHAHAIQKSKGNREIDVLENFSRKQVLGSRFVLGKMLGTYPLQEAIAVRKGGYANFT